MRRLNGILEVLSHPDERALYDRSLVGDDPIWHCSTAARDDAARREPPDWDGLWCGARWRRPATTGDAFCTPPADWEVERAYAREGARRSEYTSSRQLEPGAKVIGSAWRRDARWRRRAMLRGAVALAGAMVLVLLYALMPSGPPVRKPVVPSAASPSPLPAPTARRRPRAPSPAPAGAQTKE